MKKLLFALFFATVMSPALRAQTGIPAEVQTRLQFVLDSLRENTTHPNYGQRYPASLSAAIIKDGEIWAGATGKASTKTGEAATTAHKYRIYSSTKTFTASLILSLMAEGRLSLDDSMMKYVFPKNALLDSTVTIRQLLTHRTGFSDYTDDPDFQLQVLINPSYLWKPAELLPYAKKWTGKDTAEYSSTNYIILGMIAEKVMGDTTLEQAFRKRFYEKVGMASAYLPFNESPTAGPMAQPHDDLSSFSLTPPNKIVEISPDIISFDGIIAASWATGGIVCTATDLAKWGYALYRGNVIPQAALDSMLLSLTGATDDDWPGYGIFLDEATGPGFVGHGGASIGYRSLIGFNKELNLSIAVQSNHGGGCMSCISRELIYEITGNRPTSRDNAFENGGVTEFLVYPNPAVGQTAVSFYVSEPREVELTLTDKLGRTVKTMRQNLLEAGKHTFDLELNGLPADVYFVKVAAGNRQQTRMIVVN